MRGWRSERFSTQKGQKRLAQRAEKRLPQAASENLKIREGTPLQALDRNDLPGPAQQEGHRGRHRLYYQPVAGQPLHKRPRLGPRARALTQRARGAFFFTQSLHQPSGLMSPVTDLQDFGATNRLQSAHFFPSFGLGLYDTAFSCPYTIRTSASTYFSEDSPSTKLKYDATAAI
jgi:hypothetical protein